MRLKGVAILRQPYVAQPVLGLENGPGLQGPGGSGRGGANYSDLPSENHSMNKFNQLMIFNQKVSVISQYPLLVRSLCVVNRVVGANLSTVKLSFGDC